MRPAIALLVTLLLVTPSWAISMSGPSMAGMSMNLPETALADWGDDMIAWWPLEANGTDTRVNSAGSGSCGGTGTNCDLIPSGAIANDALHQQGSASIVWSAIETDYVSCAAGTCGALRRSGSSDRSISYFCWYRSTAASTSSILLDNMGGGVTGYQLQVAGSTVKCYVDAVERLGGTFSSNDWTHMACVFDDTANTLTAYTDATASATTSVSTMTDSSLGVGMGVLMDTFVSTGFGYEDECGVYGGVLSAKSVCRICSCGLDGALCKRIGTQFSSTGRNGAECGGCTLPDDASAAAPS